MTAFFLVIHKILLKYLVIIILITGILIPADSKAQYVNSISIERRNVFDSLYYDSFFASGIFNDLHIMTKEYVIEDEMLFQVDEELFDFDIYETERELRSLNIFSNAAVTAIPLENGDFDVKIITQDRWSLEPSLLYGTGGGAYNIGFGLREHNLLGTNTYLQLDGLYRSENNMGLEGLVALSQRRLFRTPFSIDLELIANNLQTSQFFSLKKRYLNYLDANSYGIDFKKSFGDIFYYNTVSGTQRLPFRELRGRGYYSLSWISSDQVYFTALAQLDNVDRGDDVYRQAYDNTAKIMLSFSSVADEYQPVNRINTYLTQDLCTGGYGNAVLGKAFKTKEGGEDLYYLGAQGEQSVLIKNLYLYGQVTGASAFQGNATAKYTYLEFNGLGFWALSPQWILATRLRQQTAWNWDASRQLVLDNDAGLRGYGVNEISGDNRIVGNLEMRFFPNWGISFIKFSGAAFLDFGTAWKQDIKLYQTKWYQSAGLGIRIHNLKSSADNEVIRFDFAYNFNLGKWGEIIISSGQLFSLIAPHDYKLPEFFGTEFDEY